MNPCSFYFDAFFHDTKVTDEKECCSHSTEILNNFLLLVPLNNERMSWNSLFRKKSVHDILEQVRTNDQNSDAHALGKHLKVRDLAAFGIAAIIGAGIFSTIGEASSQGGPAVIFLFLFTAIACGFAAFAYAEFASMVPVSGSAYTYSYVAFGEIIAWIIGWALIMEYAIGNITVAISWSDYFTNMLEGIHIKALGIPNGIHLPSWIQMDYLTASNGFHEAQTLISAGKHMGDLDSSLILAREAWMSAPQIFGFHLIFDLPALFIIVLITWLVYRGMKESRNASNIMVVIKLAIILLVIGVGLFYVDTNNWSPFAPNGISGILKGVSAVFFAYIGFDAISTTAEECENPQRDLPRGMMWAIIICTILYIIIALVLTGIVSYDKLAVGDPLAFVFNEIHLPKMAGIISISAVVAMASVLLVFQMGQPRIWMSMSRDGLLPKRFAKVHPKYKTPSFATIVVGFVVAIPALFMNLTMVTDLCSIGTLFAFVLVCGGVLVLQNKKDIPRGKFKTPYVNGGIFMPVLLIAAIAFLFTSYRGETMSFIQNKPTLKTSEEMLLQLNESQIETLKQQAMNINQSLSPSKNAVELDEVYAEEKGATLLASHIQAQGWKHVLTKNEGWSHFADKIPSWIFILFTIFITIMAVRHKLSLIPILGLLSCLYMMSQLALANWIYFTIWLLLGLVIYFLYGRKHSKLAQATT
jgi:amino acid transporter